MDALEKELEEHLRRWTSDWVLRDWPDSTGEWLGDCVRRTAQWWRLLDRWISLRSERAEARCAAACRACCAHRVASVEPCEHVTLYAMLRGRSDLLELMEAAAYREDVFEALYADRLAAGLSEDAADQVAMDEYYRRGLLCPLNTPSGDCGVYAVRPAPCRLYLSLSDPRWCIPEHLNGVNNNSFLLELPESVEMELARLSRLFEWLELPESLSGGILAMNATEGDWSQCWDVSTKM